MIRQYSLLLAQAVPAIAVRRVEDRAASLRGQRLVVVTQLTAAVNDLHAALERVLGLQVRLRYLQRLVFAIESTGPLERGCIVWHLALVLLLRLHVAGPGPGHVLEVAHALLLLLHVHHVFFFLRSEPRLRLVVGHLKGLASLLQLFNEFFPLLPERRKPFLGDPATVELLGAQ